MSDTNGSSGLGSSISDHMLNNTLLMVNTGLHCSFNMFRHILPTLLMLQWKILVVNTIFEGLKGYLLCRPIIVAQYKN